MRSNAAVSDGRSSIEYEEVQQPVHSPQEPGCPLLRAAPRGPGSTRLRITRIDTEFHAAAPGRSALWLAKHEHRLVGQPAQARREYQLGVVIAGCASRSLRLISLKPAAGTSLAITSGSMRCSFGVSVMPEPGFALWSTTRKMPRA